MNTCPNCAHFLRLTHEGGKCLHDPPVWGGDSWTQPLVNIRDGCGQWQDSRGAVHHSIPIRNQQQLFRILRAAQEPGGEKE